MHRLVALAAVALVAASSAFAADSWPDRPVHLVVPYPPGGNVDNAARIVSERLQAKFGQAFVIENKPGAGGMIAGEYVSRAAPDGYTMFVSANGPLLFSPLIYRRPVYDWKKNFLPVSSISFTPLVLQVGAASPYRTLGDLLDAAKKPGSKLTMASPGAGTQNHLVSELLQRETGARWLTVQYKGNAPANTDLFGGQVDFDFDQLSVALPFVRDGRTRALAVTSPQRLPQLPNVPTLQEAGLKNISAETFTGLFAVAGTSPDIVQRLSAALREILADKAVRDKFEAMGAEARGDTPEAFTRFLTKEDATWTQIIRQANITAE